MIFSVKRTKIAGLVLGVGLAILPLPASVIVGQQSAPGNGQKKNPIKPRVWQISFKGNETFPALMLRGAVAVQSLPFWKRLVFWRTVGPVFWKDEVRKDVIRLKRFYQRRGFSDVEVSYRLQQGDEPWQMEITFLITENEPILIRNLTLNLHAPPKVRDFIRGHPKFEQAMKSQIFKEGKRYAPVREPDVKGQFILALKNMGFAYADMNLTATVDSAEKRADVTFDVYPGPRTYIDSIRVTGQYTVSPDMIRRNSGLKQGTYFNEKMIQKAQRELFNHPLFRFATISIPDQPRDSSLVLLIRVREEEKRSVGLKVGFGREDLARGQLSWTHRNVARLGHKFSATIHVSFIEQQLSVDYLFPYVFNENSSFLVNPFVQHLLQPNYELFRWGFNNSLIYQYTRRLTSTISYEFTRNFEMAPATYSELPDSTRDYNISAIQLSGYYTTDLRQNRGWALRPYMEFSGLIGKASFNFQKFAVDLRRYVQLTKNLTAAGRIETGLIFHPQTDSLPNHLRFYAGGTNSVRGWDHHMMGPKRPIFNKNNQFSGFVPIGGRALMAFNLELRQELDFFIEGLGMAVFWDGGQVWRRAARIGSRPLRYSSGLGVRYESPIGPIRVDVGYKINPSSRDLDRYRGIDYGSLWDRFALHFSIGQSF